jgi:iron complex outermembrane receptor protein
MTSRNQYLMGVSMSIDTTYARSRTLLLATAAALMPAVAQAQDETLPRGTSGADGEIVVSARKQAESLVDVPLSIQALTAEDIRLTGARDLQDLSKFTPGLFFVNGAQGQGSRAISEVRFRGLSTSIPTPTNQVGSVFIDGNFVLSGAQSLDFNDIEQVEVIKGPQAAFFGRSTFAGAVNFKTRDPADELRGDILLDYSPSYDSYQISGSIEGPLAGEILSARLSGSTKLKGGQWTTSDGGTLGEEQTRSINLTLLFKPASNLKIKLRGSYIENQDGPSNSIFYSYNQRGNCRIGTPVTVNTTGGEVNATFNRNFQCGDIPFNAALMDKNTSLITLPAVGDQPALNLTDVLVNNSLGDPLLARAPKLERFGLHSVAYRLAGSLEYDIGEGLSFNANGSYAKQDIAVIQDNDGTPNPQGSQAIPMFFEDAGFEGRLNYDNKRWLSVTAGVNYFTQNIQASTDTGVSVNNLSIVAPNPNPIRVAQRAVSNQNDKVKTIGFFFGADITPLDWLTLTAEGRYQMDDYTTFGGSNATGVLIPRTIKTKRFTPRLIATVRPMEDTTIYASYSYAFLPGVINSGFLGQSPENQAAILAAFPDFQIELAPEKLTNYEIGIKKAIPSARAYIAISAFKMDWVNIKTSNAIIVPQLANPVFSATVPGLAEVKGFELEGTWSPLHQLSLRTTLGYTDATFVDYANRSYNAFFLGIPSANTYKADGNRLPRTPAWSGTASASWEDLLTGDWSYRLRGDVLYQGKQYTDETNLTSLKAFTTVNAAVEFFTEDLSIRLYANNLFDKLAWNTGRRFTDVSPTPLNFATAGQGSFLTPINRREVGVQLRKSF